MIFRLNVVVEGKHDCNSIHQNIITVLHTIDNTHGGCFP